MVWALGESGDEYGGGGESGGGCRWEVGGSCKVTLA